MKTHVHPRLVASITLLALLLALAACAEQRVVEPLRAARAQAPTAQPSETLTAPADTPAQQAGTASGSLEIHGVDIGFQPANLHVQQPGSYSIPFTNDGGIPHDVTFPDGTKIVANAKETKTAVVDVPASGLSFICSVPGHAEAGMKGAISVGGSTASAENADDHRRAAAGHRCPARRQGTGADPVSTRPRRPRSPERPMTLTWWSKKRP